MGHNSIISDVLLAQIWEFLAYLFPFLASVAFTLFLRKVDGYYTLINQIKKQREEIKQTREDLEIVRDEASELIETFNKKLEDQTNQFNTHIDKQSYKLDESMSYIFETNKEKLKTETDSLIQQSIEKVNRISNRVDDFENHFSEREERLEARLAEIKENSNSSLKKMEKYESFILAQADDTAKLIEERLADYIRKFQDRLEKIFDQANYSISSISKDMKNEVRVLKEEVIELESSFQVREGEFWKDVESKKLKLFQDFSNYISDSEKNLDNKLMMLKNISESITNRANKADTDLEDKRDSLIRGVKLEIDNFQAILDNFRIEIINKRDEILNDTRRQATVLQSNIVSLEEKYLETEMKIYRQAEQQKSDLNQEFGRFEEDLSDIKRKAQTDMNIDLSDIRYKIEELNLSSNQKMKAVDEHFSDLKIALEESAKELLIEVEKHTSKITVKTDKEISKVDQKLDYYLKEWNTELEKLKGSYYKDVESLHQHLESIQIDGNELVVNIKNEFVTGKAQLDSVYESYKQGLGDKTNEIVIEIQNKIKKSQDEVDSILNRVQKAGLNLYEKQEALLTEYADKLYKDLESKLEKVRYEAEEVLEEIQKSGNNLLEKQEEKIDKFNSSLDERISRQLTILIDKGQLQLDALESRIAAYVGDVKGNIESSLKNAREDSDRQITNFNSQVIKTFKEIESANQEFLESSRKEFSRTKDEFLKVKTSIDIEINRVTELKNGLYNFLSEESSKLQNQKNKSEQISEEINKTSQIAENLMQRTEELKDKIKMLMSVDEKISYLQGIYSGFEAKVSSLEKVNGRVSELLKSVENSEKSTVETNNRISEVLSEIDILQQKENELEENLEQAEKKTAFLQARNLDIKSIEAKFEKVESLMMDLSARHKQIATLQNRIESLKEETEAMKNNLENLLSETDDRFEKLSDFLSVVDSVTTPQGQLKKGNVKDQNMQKKKRATVIQLYDNFNWTAETIAEKLNMEQSLVDAIINNKK